jgi:triphosphoribosyl-dephospho-CoA synthetase
VEAALAIAALVTVLVLCLSGLSAIAGQVRCIDAAREAARLAARGDQRSAQAVVEAIAPSGAQLRIQRDGEFVVADVTADHLLLPGITLAARAVAAVEQLVVGG